MNKLVVIQSYQNRFEAECAQEFLKSSEIDSIVSADDCGGMRPWLGAGTGGVQLSVIAEDVLKAKEVLQIS